MNKKKNFGRKLSLRKETITSLENLELVKGGGTRGCIPCCKTIPTEVICTLYDCPGSDNSCDGTCSCW